MTTLAAAGNAILESLSASSVKPLLDAAEHASFRQGERLQHAHEPAGPALFILRGLCSFIRTSRKGTTAEVGVVGREGVIALPFLLTLDEAPFDVIAQSTGEMLRVPRGDLARAAAADASLLHRLCTFNESLMVQAMETTACNRLHAARDRCARWLLTAGARLDSDVLDITHDFLALMLGASRARLSLILAGFERRGFIRQARGRVVICDVRALRRIACDCAPHDLGCV